MFVTKSVKFANVYRMQTFVDLQQSKVKVMYCLQGAASMLGPLRTTVLRTQHVCVDCQLISKAFSFCFSHPTVCLFAGCRELVFPPDWLRVSGAVLSSLFHPYPVSKENIK